MLGNSYNSQERVVCAGYDNGDIKMFDLRTMTLRWETTIANGVRMNLCYTLPKYIRNSNSSINVKIYI